MSIKQAVQAAIESLGLSVDAKFIPWSQSRNKGEDRPSLNWLVTVKKDESLADAYADGYGIEEEG